MGVLLSDVLFCHLIKFVVEPTFLGEVAEFPDAILLNMYYFSSWNLWM